MAADFFIGESLVGDGNEVAHIDLIIGSKSGPAGQAFVNALSNQREGHSTLLAVVSPNLPAKPDALLFNKVTIKGATQAVQMFGPAQARSEEHTSELQSQSNLVCRLLLEKKKKHNSSI